MTEAGTILFHDPVLVVCYFFRTETAAEKGAQSLRQVLDIGRLDRRSELVSPTTGTRYTFARWSELEGEGYKILDLVHIQVRGNKVGSVAQVIVSLKQGQYALETISHFYYEKGQSLEAVDATLKNNDDGNFYWGRAWLYWVGTDHPQDRHQAEEAALALQQQIKGAATLNDRLTKHDLAYGALWQLSLARVSGRQSRTDLLLISENKRSLAERVNLEFLFGYRFLLAELYLCWAARYADQYQSRRPGLLKEINTINGILPQVVGGDSVQPDSGQQSVGKADIQRERSLFQAVSGTTYAFAKHISEIAELQNTLDTNISNYWEQVCTSWDLAQPDAGSLYKDYRYTQQTVQQIELDLRHYHQVYSRLRMAMTQLQVRLQLNQGWLTASLLEAQHQEAEMEQRRNLILTLVGLVLGLGEILSILLDLLPATWQAPVGWVCFSVWIVLVFALGSMLLSLRRFANSGQEGDQSIESDGGDKE